MDHMTQC